jgi:predicted glycosyltransferase/nucleoside-diphosphate-sugar epimerase
VTGAAGFIGSRLTAELLRARWHVVGIDAFTTSYDPARKRANIAPLLVHARFTLLQADVTRLPLEAVLLPGDVVFHLAGEGGVRMSWTGSSAAYYMNNVASTHAVLEAARHRDVARVVHASSSAVYGDAGDASMSEDRTPAPITPYGVSKLAAEMLCRLYRDSFGLDVVSARLFNVYGPGQRPDLAVFRFIEQLSSAEELVVFGDGSQRRDLTFVDDAVAALAALALSPAAKCVVNVGGGSSVSVMTLVSHIERLLGRRAEVRFLPAAPGDARNTLADVDRIRAIVQRPPTPLEDGLAAQLRWQLASRPRSHASGAGRRQRETRPRVLLHAHDSFGLGHVRRTFAIAHAVHRHDPDVRLLVVSGSPLATAWALPPSAELIVLPSVTKARRPAEFVARDGKPVGAVLASRRGHLAAAVMRFRPHAMLVDHDPLGILEELELALSLVREGQGCTRVFLGLRDVIDDPQTVRAKWRKRGIYEAIEAFYDEVAVFGSRSVIDTIVEYDLAHLPPDRVHYVGYVSKDLAMERDDGESPWPDGDRAPRILVMGGGGQDAAPLFDCVLREWSILDAAGASALLVTGPLLDAAAFDDLRSRAAGFPHLGVSSFTGGVLSRIAAADVIVSMAGYNTVVEALAARRPLLLCPRVRPLAEQLIRAQLLERLGLARVHRVDVAGGDGIAEAILETVAASPPPESAWSVLDLAGADRTAELLIAAAREVAGVR